MCFCRCPNRCQHSTEPKEPVHAVARNRPTERPPRKDPLLCLFGVLLPAYLPLLLLRFVRVVARMQHVCTTGSSSSPLHSPYLLTFFVSLAIPVSSIFRPALLSFLHRSVKLIYILSGSSFYLRLRCLGRLIDGQCLVFKFAGGKLQSILKYLFPKLSIFFF